jgi:hypothetical protein
MNRLQSEELQDQQVETDTLLEERNSMEKNLQELRLEVDTVGKVTQ